MIDTDNVKGGYCSKQEMIFYLNAVEEVKRLTKTLELIGKNMEYDAWMHTLIKDVIGYEKWQAKEMIE